MDAQRVKAHPFVSNRNGRVLCMVADERKDGMAYQYSFRIEDVTCEKCDARLREALTSLPRTQLVEYVRTPANEAEVKLAAEEALSSQLIEETVTGKSAGTTHHYRVRWGDA